MAIYKIKQSEKSSLMPFDNILPESICDRVPKLWKKSLEYPEDKFLILFKAVRRVCLNNADASLCQRICDTESGTAIFSLTLMLIESLMRLPASKLTLKNVQTSLEEYKLSSKYVDLMCESVTDKRSQERLEQATITRQPNLDRVTGCEWSLDISICSNSLSRLLEPNIKLSMKLSSGKKIDFEMSLPVFHKLRFNIAKILKAIADLEKRHVIQIAE